MSNENEYHYQWLDKETVEALTWLETLPQDEDVTESEQQA